MFVIQVLFKPEYNILLESFYPKNPARNRSHV